LFKSSYYGGIGAILYSSKSAEGESVCGPNRAGS
jgi:hypothetical protein